MSLAWTQRTLPASTFWYGLTYGGGLFVAVASSSTAASTSTDGITWTQRTLPTSVSWISVAYGNGIFVAVAEVSNVAATSPDGITWTQRTLPANTTWSRITYGNGTFVAVAASTTIAATSPDGITWTQRTLPTTANWSAVAYGNSTFVALSKSATAATSPDGITWTQRTLPTTANWSAVAYGNGTFVAVATSSSIAATSADGITWTQRTLPVSAGWFSVTYGNGTFVAIAASSSIAATSADGITWTQEALPVSADWRGAAYGSDVFVSIAINTSIAITGADSSWQGSFDLPHEQVDAVGLTGYMGEAAGELIPITSYASNYDILFPALQQGIVGLTGGLGSSAPEVPPLTVAGTGEEANAGTAATSLLSLTYNAQADLPITNGQANFSLYPITLTSTGGRGEYVDSSFPFMTHMIAANGGLLGFASHQVPRFTSEASGYQDTSLRGDFTLKLFRSQGIGTTGVTSLADTTLRRLNSTASGITGGTGSAATTLKLFALNFTGLPEFQLSAEYELPVFLISDAAGGPQLIPTGKSVWCVNLLTGAHSQFTSYDFDSIICFEGRYYGFTGTHMHELDTPLDSYAEVTWGANNYASDRAKYAPEVRIKGRSDGEVIVNLTANEDKKREYEIDVRTDESGFVTRRVKTAKGISGNVWNVGVKLKGDATIESVEVDLVESQRSG